MEEIDILKDQVKRLMEEEALFETETISAETVDALKSENIIDIDPIDQPSQPASRQRCFPYKKGLMILAAIMVALLFFGDSGFPAINLGSLFWLFVIYSVWTNGENQNRVSKTIMVIVVAMLFFNASFSMFGPILLIGLGISMLVRNRSMRASTATNIY